MTAAAINRTDIMTAAWARVNHFRALGLVKTVADLRARLSYELRQAWSYAKLAASKTAVAESAKNWTEGERAAADLRMLENKDRWNDADRKEADRLRGIIHAESAADYMEKRDLIASSGGRFCSVTFTKADGSDRVMQVQPAKLAMHVKGDAATEAGKRAVATRKARHPNLLPVWDVAKQAPRSINLATVKTITVNGMAHGYT